MKNKLFLFLVFAYLANVCLSAQTSGTCGANLSWTLQNGILTISGTGAMSDFGAYAAPWNSERSNISSVVINTGVTSIGNHAFSNCSGLTSVAIPNSVASIGGYAFSNCSSLTSVTIPTSVTIIGYYAFSNCSSLTSVTFPNSVTLIVNSAFLGCISLTSPIYNSHMFAYMPPSYSGAYTIPSGIESLASGAFSGCSSLTSVTIPNSVTSIRGGSYIDDCCFFGCSNLDSIIFESPIPASLCDTSELYGETYIMCHGLGITEDSSTRLYVPCGSLETYKTAKNWSEYALKFKYEESRIQCAVLVEGTGQVNVPQTICDTILEAVPSYGYHFVKWTDGNTDNPRDINPEIEATYIAEFAVDKSGKCGDDLLLTWVYDSSNKKLTISGNGKLDSNLRFGALAPNEMTSLAIENGVQSIGRGAFYGISSLTSVSIGKDVTKINESAFYNCENLSSLRTYATIPATIYSSTFDGVNKFSCTLYVPNESVDMYKSASGWRDFYNIQGFDAQSSIENVIEDSATRKFYHNGMLYILLPDGTRYDATGKKIE